MEIRVSQKDNGCFECPLNIEDYECLTCLITGRSCPDQNDTIPSSCPLKKGPVTITLEE